MIIVKIIKEANCGVSEGTIPEFALQDRGKAFIRIAGPSPRTNPGLSKYKEITTKLKYLVSHCTTFLFTVSAVIMTDMTGQLTVFLDNKKKTLRLN